MISKLHSVFRYPDMTIMGARRATALLAAVALFGLAEAAPARASQPQSPSPETLAPAVPSDTAVPAPPEAAAPAIALPDSPAGLAITGADRLPGALAARLAEPKGPLHPRLSRKEREAMAAFYALGNYQPLWVVGGAWNAAAQAVIGRLKSADEEGLNSADYPIPAIGLSAGDPVDAAVEAELKLSAAAVVYARDARGGRIEPSRLSNLITPDLELPAADAVLTSLAAAKDSGAALAAYNPPHAGYRALKAKLAQVRASQPSNAKIEGDLVANMERWRWLPSDMGRRHVFVNVPEFRLRLMQDGRAIHEARVIVGKPETPTPLFSDEMDHAIVNPSWYVPPSIFKNEFHSDPWLAAARGYEVVRTRDGGISVRQPPGERNALGFIKFMFPNRHAVYLHDTPNRRLFAADKRAFSHGCVRLDQPFRFGEFVLGSQWSEERLKSLIGRGERTIRLPEKIPVHLAYFTLLVDDKGELRHLADIYGVNNKVRGALGLPRDATPVAEAPPPRKTARAQNARARTAQTTQTARTRTAHAPRQRPVRRIQTVVHGPMPYAQPFFWWVR